jgi:UDP-N-acetylmuramoylalanine--D-glutamate ligase
MAAYDGKQVVVVGAGRTGLALTAFFLGRGARVILSDSRSAADCPELAALATQGVTLDCGGHSPELFVAADLIAISPGVPLTLPAIVAAQQQGVPVLGEIEIACRELTAPLVAITGTNGKSTTTCLLGDVFRAWGKKSFVGGNLGTPLIEAVDEQWDWLLAELSSFQLEAIDTFRPRYGLLLNLSPDHLDRYPDMAAYLAAKQQLFINMADDDVAVLNGDDPQVLALAEAAHCRKVLFSSTRLLDEGMSRVGDELVWRWAGHETRFATGQLQLCGSHNLENVMAALIPPLLEGCPAEIAWPAVCAFSGLEHRMVRVRKLDGVVWYNDSKGTNVGSVVKSLAGLAAPVTLIAGGRDKGGDYGPLAEAAVGKVAQLILIGEAAERMGKALEGKVPCHLATTLEEAVCLAQQLTPCGGSVLLSPACSSFDMFSSYAERGEAFAQAVNQLPAKGEG